MATPVPFRWVSGLPWKAQQEIERNFLHLQGQVPKSQNRIYIACHDAQAWESAAADLVLDGTTDVTVLNTLLALQPNADYYFSTGTVVLTGTLNTTQSCRFHGSYYDTSGAVYNTTTFQGAGASSNFLAGPTNPILVNNVANGGGVWENITFTHTWTGATTSTVFFAGGISNSFCKFSYLRFNGYDFVFNVNGASSLSQAVIENLFGLSTATLCSNTNGISQSVISNTRGVIINQSGVFNSLILFADSITPAAESNGNKILPQTTYPPGGAAGGSLTGTYPNPTFAGRDGSVDALNKDLLPSELGAPQSGVTAFPPAGTAPSGAAGGSLAGTYPNPTFAGRDTSVDAINKDLLPATLLDQGMPMPQVFPPINYIPLDVIWVNVKDHGAVGDGVTDDTAAINAALTFANWPTKKAVLYFPPGQYLISSTITLSGGGASSTPQLALVGWGATIITTSVITMFTITNTISSVTRIHFQGLIIEPNATGAIGVSLKNAEFVTFNDCEFLGSGGTAVSIVASSTSPYCGMYDCNFSNLASGIVFNGNADYFTLSNCNFAEGLAGTGITGWIDVPVSTGSSNGVRITGCVFRGLAATQPVIQMKFAVNWTITGCAFVDSPQESIFLGTNGSCKNTAITGCTFQKGLQHDITINGARLNAITGCLFGNRGAGVAASTFANIRIKNTFGGAAGADNIVSGCTSEDTGTALIGFAQLDDGCVNCSFIGNFYSIKIVQGHAQPVIIDSTLVQFHKPDEIDGMIGQPLGVTQFPPVAAGSSTPTGAAGGSLASTYPNPIFSGRDTSVDDLNKDILPAALLDSGPVTVQAFPPSAASGSPTGSAGGSLAGTYPNPIFAGRDSSTDALNKDLLPSALLEAGPTGPQAFPPLTSFPPSGAAGGSLAGTYPNPTFAGRDASVDAINKDILPADLVGPIPFGVSAFPYQPIPAAATDGVTITVTSGLLTLVLGGVGNAYLAPEAQNTVKGRIASGSGIVQDLTAAQLLDVLRTSADFTQGFLLMGA